MEPLAPADPAEALFSALNELAIRFINGPRVPPSAISSQA